MKRILGLAILLAVASSLHAQYWSDYVLEKGFNSRDYFLQPHRIIALHTKSLDAGLLGIRPDSLSEISYQPALLSHITGTKLYIDLKGSEEKFVLYPRNAYPIYAYINDCFLPPYMARYAERKLQPMLSIIYLGDVASHLLPGFKYGLSYELIQHQGKYYEYVPLWYYGGRDAYGVTAEASKNFPELEVNLKEDGLDEKSETAHFLDAYLSLRLAKFLSLGVKASRIQTDINGDYSRLNNYDDPVNSNNYRSSYLNSRGNEATLKQDEISGGELVKFADNRTIGLFAGWVNGSHNQTLFERDSSHYSWGDQSQNGEFSHSFYTHNNQSRWQHKGDTRFAGVNGQLPMQQKISFRFRLEYLKSDLDIYNGDTVIDTSDNHYRYRDYQTQEYIDYIYNSGFADNRSGVGEKQITQKTGAVGLIIPMYNSSQVTVGLFAQSLTSNLLVFEDAQVWRYNYDYSQNSYYPRDEQTIGIEDKTLRLDQKISTTRIALPVVADFSLGKGFIARLGAVKQFLKSSTKEVVDIWYRTAKTTVIQPSGTTVDTQPPRIDRYQAIPVRKNDSSTDFRLGLSFEPSKIVRFDIAMGTRWTELENWQIALVVSF